MFKVRKYLPRIKINKIIKFLIFAHFGTILKKTITFENNPKILRMGDINDGYGTYT